MATYPSQPSVAGVTSPLQQTALGIIVGSPILAAIFVFLRIYSRRKMNVRLGWDDYSIVAALLFSTALIGPSWRHVKMWHIGLHVWQIPQREMEPDLDEYYGVLLSFQLLNIPVLPLVKVSIVLLLLRVGSVISWLKKVLYGILIFTVGSSLIPWVLYIFICPPKTGNTWAPRTFGNLHCMGRYAMGEMLIWVTCANLITDLLILPIPFIIVKRWLSARWRSKLVVCAVFMCGLIVTAIGGAKIYLSYRDRLFAQVKLDWTYDINYCMSHVENNVAIIMANIPILRGLVTRWLSKFRTDTGHQATYNSSRNGHLLLEREFKLTWPWKTINSTVSGGYPRKTSSSTRKTSSTQEVFPCGQDDFEFSLVTPDGDKFPRCPSPICITPTSRGSSDLPPV